MIFQTSQTSNDAMETNISTSSPFTPRRDHSKNGKVSTCLEWGILQPAQIVDVFMKIKQR